MYNKEKFFKVNTTALVHVNRIETLLEPFLVPRLIWVGDFHQFLAKLAALNNV